MLEINNTRKYLQKLKQVYQQRGLVAAVKHELVATFYSLLHRMERVDISLEERSRHSGVYITPPSKGFLFHIEVSKRRNKRRTLERLVNPLGETDGQLAIAGPEKGELSYSEKGQLSPD